MPALAPVDELGWTVREPLFQAGSPRGIRIMVMGKPGAPYSSPSI